MYLWLKLLHISAVVVFLGNISLGLFWHTHAARTRDRHLLAHAVDGIIRSDRMFTVPSVVVIFIAGVLLASRAQLPLLRTPWIGWSLLLFSVSGLAFMFRIAPLQREMLRYAQSGDDSGQFQFETYASLARRWELWGAVGLLTPLAALALMVLKPSL